jgi:hypothetical protein
MRVYEIGFFKRGFVLNYGKVQLKWGEFFEPPRGSGSTQRASEYQKPVKNLKFL